MIALLQRVLEASVAVDEHVIGAIGPGLLVFIGFEREDRSEDAKRLVNRTLGYRLFSDSRGLMNRSLIDTGAGLLIVPQFTLAADTDAGLRPGFSHALATPEGRVLFGETVAYARSQHAGTIEIGRFGAHMQVHLINDGPVTFWLRTANVPRTENTLLVPG
ncbi:MAG: D-aminoacyl-tRNA deacylase [Acidiferrobacteraceae bacterium]